MCLQAPWTAISSATMSRSLTGLSHRSTTAARDKSLTIGRDEPQFTGALNFRGEENNKGLFLCCGQKCFASNNRCKFSIFELTRMITPRVDQRSLEQKSLLLADSVKYTTTFVPRWTQQKHNKYMLVYFDSLVQAHTGVCACLKKILRASETIIT